MLVALWSPKGGSGTSVLAAACSLVLARRGGARLADLAGDQPAIFGLGAEPPTGLADWLGAGPAAPGEALERLEVAVAAGVGLLPRGATPRALAPPAAAERGAALAVALRDGPLPTVLDAGGGREPAARAAVELADVALVVVRGCYLALRRAVVHPLLARTAGVVLVDEAGRSLSAREIAGVLDRPVRARVPVRIEIARAVDAGVLATRLPDVLARAAATTLAAAGLGGTRSGRAA